MGVEFFPCIYCDETYGDCGYYFICDCNVNYCSEDCANVKEDEVGKRSCRVCREEFAPDHWLIGFLLKTLCLTREEATKLYYDSIEKQTKGK